MVHGPPSKYRKSSTNSQIANNENFDEEANSNLPTPPDGGWGWMVVFGSLMIHIITDGITYSFGLFYTEFLDYFHEGKGYTAWIVSIMVGVTYASGPISSSFVNRYGCRVVTIVGAILAASCIIVSIFAQNVLTLIITIGLGTGFGFGLIYLPAIVSVTMYFDARRSLATGIAVCGSGFGTFLFSPLTENLIAAYGWRGAMLIIGGIVLNCIIFGAMFRPLEASTERESPTAVATIQNKITLSELEPLNGKQYLQLPAKPDVPLSRSNSMGPIHDRHLNNNSDGYANGKIQSATVSKSSSSNDVVRSSMSQPHLCDMDLTQLREIKKRSASGTMYRPDILYQGSLLNIPEYVRSRNDLSSTGALNRYGSTKRRSMQPPSECEETVKCCGCVTCSEETRDTFAEMMNFALLSDGVFVIFALSNFCTSIGLNMPYVYVASQGETLGLTDKECSYLLAIIGLANTVGRIILGYVSDKTWVNRLWVYNTCLIICGIATLMTPLCTDFNTLSLYCSVFGFTIGAYVGLTSVILVDLLGLDKLTNAFGILLLFQGVASFIGAPIGGWLFDITLSYHPAFILAGAMILLSGLIMFAIPIVQRYRMKKADLQNGTEVNRIS